ncbi:MAG: hypothetical protein HY048_07500 [Acidobacteria bacterium]|nr:hypothetical protein [Acidobacteriota bacterium]
MKPLLFWLPRVLGVLLAAFITIFAADAFEGNFTISQKLVAFVVHLIPTAVVLLAVAVAWRWEVPGGLLFVLAGAFHTSWALGRGLPSVDILLISGPAYLVGALFVVDWFYRRRTLNPEP